MPAARLAWTPDLVRVMAGLMLSLFVAAMDSTVVGTALPTIARELGEFQLYPWVFSGYLITATTTVPIWGRLADRYGRRLVLLTGITIFVTASMLCAASPGMAALIVFRTLQGVGAGCIQPVVFTLVGDIFPLPQRARLQGFFSSMWAVAAVIGPALGAVFVSTIGWRWIFLINLPIGLVAGTLIFSHRERRPEAVVDAGIDVRSAILLTAGIGLLLWGLGTGSQTAAPVWWAIGAGAGDARRVLDDRRLAGHRLRDGPLHGTSAHRHPVERRVEPACRGHSAEPVLAHHRRRGPRVADGGAAAAVPRLRARSSGRSRSAGRGPPGRLHRHNGAVGLRAGRVARDPAHLPRSAGTGKPRKASRHMKRGAAPAAPPGVRDECLSAHDWATRAGGLRLPLLLVLLRVVKGLAVLQCKSGREPDDAADEDVRADRKGRLGRERRDE